MTEKADNRILILHTPMGESTSYERFKNLNKVLEHDFNQFQSKELREYRDRCAYGFSAESSDGTRVDPLRGIVTYSGWGESVVDMQRNLHRAVYELKMKNKKKKYTVIDGILNNPHLIGQ